MTGKKMIFSAAVIIAILFGSVIITENIINNGEDTGEIIGNPNYEDSLYIDKEEFKNKFEKDIQNYNYTISLDAEKREMQYKFDNDMILRIGLQSNNSMLSFIILNWNEGQTDGIEMCRILYHIFGSDASEASINTDLMELEAIAGNVDVDDHEIFLPDNPVRFSIEKKDKKVRLYINDEAMGY